MRRHTSVRVYTSLISAYGKGGQWPKAKLAFDTLMVSGTEVDTGVYNALLSAAVAAGSYTRSPFSSTQAVLVTQPRIPLSHRIGGNHAANVSHEMCIR